MKKKHFIFLILLFLFIPSVNAATTEVVSCGETNDIPAFIVDLVRFAFKLIKYLVPVLIVVLGSFDFIKALTSSDADMLKKAWKSFSKKLVAGILVFLLIVLFQTIIKLVTTDATTNCMNCFFVNKDGCNYYYKEELTEEEPGKVKDNQTDFGDPSTDDDSSNENIEGDTLFIGDSRTVGMCDTCSLCKANTISQNSANYDNFIKFVDQASSKLTNVKNIVVLMGVNGVSKYKANGENAEKLYFDKVSELAKNDWKNQQVIFVSINPVIDGKSSAYTEAIKAFNTKMKSDISSSKIKNLKYCDTYNNITIPTSAYDSMGLHYNNDNCVSYGNIYNYIINKCI